MQEKDHYVQKGDGRLIDVGPNFKFLLVVMKYYLKVQNLLNSSLLGYIKTIKKGKIEGDKKLRLSCKKKFIIHVRQAEEY